MGLPKKYRIPAILFLLALVLLVFTPIGRKVKGKMGSLLSHGMATFHTSMQTPLDSYEWQLEDIEGNDFDFRDKKGKVLLVNFWATWCPPCVEEMPSLQKLYNAYGDQVGFMFVAKDTPERVEKFMEKKGYDLPVYYSKSELPFVLRSKSLPTTYIIDKSGKVIQVEIGSRDWYDTGVRELLDGLITMP